MKLKISILIVIMFSIGLYAKSYSIKEYKRFYKKCVVEINKNKKTNGTQKYLAQQYIKESIVNILHMESQGMGAMIESLGIDKVFKDSCKEHCPKVSKKYFKK